jgi:hypothetical protein
MTTAVEDDGILPKNPCRIKGAGEEHAPERPVLTVVAQVFDLVNRVGMRPVGNIRKTPASRACEGVRSPRWRGPTSI